MQRKFEVLAIDTPSWTLRLKSTTDPDTQLTGLAKLLDRPKEDPSLVAKIEVNAPGWFPSQTTLPPSIFENSIYMFSVYPKTGWSIVNIRHPVFYYFEDSLDEENGIWRGTIKTGNDIGWFPLELVIQNEETLVTRIDSVAWQIWPLKLDYAKDLQAITTSIEAEYPLWIFNFNSMTEHNVGKGEGRNDRFLLLWFTQFKKVWNGLESGLKIIIENPHVALVKENSLLRPDRLKGRLSRRLEEKLAEEGISTDSLFNADMWRSSIDTPENRFVLHVINNCLIGLQRFRTAIDSPGLSPSFLARLNGWIRSLATIKVTPMFRGIGSFSGMSQGSLVLYNRAGYSAVYRAWLELRTYLEFFARVTAGRVGMRSINELYEIWCFLEIRNILIDLGFELKENKSPRWRTAGVRRDIDNSSLFKFSGPNGVQLTLSHEPVFNRMGEKGLISYTVSQRPDIVLEAHWPATEETPERRLLWIFDAKYRLKTNQVDGSWNRDEGIRASLDYLAPPDAIDQMHRYRDSIYLLSENEKSRPVISAFALYPGVFNQKSKFEKNPYSEAIMEVGIGAFPLVPGENGNRWLKEYLIKILELKNPSIVTERDSVRIPVSGLQYPDEDVLLVYLTSTRSKEYIKLFREGFAKYYHIYVQGGPSESRLRKIQYLAVIDIPRENNPTRMIRGVYLIIDKQRVKRSEISPIVSGTSTPRDQLAECHLFSIGKYLQLPHPIIVSNEGGHWFRYTSLTRLFEAKKLSDLCAVRE